MENAEEAKKFLEQVAKLAPKYTRAGVAKELKMKPSQFNTALLNALILSGERAPQFASRSAKSSSDANTIKVMKSGKSKSGRRIKIPDEIFEALEWNAGDKLNYTVTKANKLVLNKIMQDS